MCFLSLYGFVLGRRHSRKLPGARVCACAGVCVCVCKETPLCTPSNSENFQISGARKVLTISTA